MATEADRAVLTIDLGAVAENYRRLGAIAVGSEVAGVVKANGYGLGASEVADALLQAGCRRFFVAHLAEGVALRQQLPDAPIYLLNGLPTGAEADVAAANLIPILNHPGEVQRWAELARRCEHRLSAGIQLDTGMCRLGFGAAELEGLDRHLLEPIDLALVMSHLACAEDADDPLNVLQRQRFEQQRRRLPGAPASLANSSGIFLGPEFHHDLCRPGIALYGVNPTPGRTNPMQPVVTLSAPVLQVHEVQEAGTVGYGATYEIGPGGRIATVPVGYADGYLRAAGHRATARIAGQTVAIAGRVSMDLITLDVSDVPAEALHPGAVVELIGGPDGVDRLAAAADTIGYEVLTRLGTRFAREYIRPGSPG